jgi:hypothetical protein
LYFANVGLSDFTYLISNFLKDFLVGEIIFLIMSLPLIHWCKCYRLWIQIYIDF